VLGLCYKQDVPDIRETPAIPVIRHLRRSGITVHWADPVLPNVVRGLHRSVAGLRVPLDADTLARYDAVLLITAHGMFDYPQIYQRSRLIIDTRGKFRSDPLGKVVRA
jgi:UDP-N-acetyl-D-glucosamine dehydrogenase